MNTDELDLFRWRLAETIALCAPRTSLGMPLSALRTLALHPSPPLENGGDTGYRVEDSRYDCQNRWDVEQTAVDVEQLVRERVHLLPRAHSYPSAPASDLAGGRLLFSAPDYGVTDGASEYESHGFIDVADAPPWDTWVWFVQEGKASTDFYDCYIVSWVPPEFVAYADAGIRVSFVGNVAWASDVNSAFSYRLRAAGLA